MGLAVTFPYATIQHLNIRRTGGTDDAIVAIDVKVQGEVPAREIALAAGMLPDEFVESLWRPSDDEREFETKLIGVTKIETWAAFEHHKVRFGHARQVYGKVAKLSFTPKGGQVPTAETILTISVDEPAEALVNALVENIKGEMRVEIEPPPELDL